jgi:hypothetical protein
MIFKMIEKNKRQRQFFISKLKKVAVGSSETTANVYVTAERQDNPKCR